MNTKYILLLFLIIIIIIILNNNQEKFNELEVGSPSNTLSNNEIEIQKIQIEENKDKFKKFQNLQQQVFNNSNLKIGYRPTKKTNQNSLGLCPLGKFYNSKFDKNKINLEKCKDCSKCSKGNYLKEGCAGNSNSICSAGKLPYEIFIKSHNKKSPFHKIINPHKHPLAYKRSFTQFDHSHL
jgi:hypothetical protein